MTRLEALKEFRADVLPGVNRQDKAAIRQAWNDWTDGLCRDGRITSEQYDQWDGPPEGD